MNQHIPDNKAPAGRPSINNLLVKITDIVSLSICDRNVSLFTVKQLSTIQGIRLLDPVNIRAITIPAKRLKNNPS